MKLCVVTATFDRRFLLVRRLLLALATQSYRNFCAVVLDDNSQSDDVRDLCHPQRWNFPLLYRRVRGDGLDIGRSYRIAFQYIPAECSIVVVLHGETVLSPNALAEFVRLLESHEEPSKFMLQGVPENLVTNRNLTDSILRGRFADVDAFTLRSLSERGAFDAVGWGQYATWPGDPFPRLWYPNYDLYRQRLRWLVGGAVCGLSWADLKRLQHETHHHDGAIYFDGDDGSGPWNVCCAFWTSTVKDLKNAWHSGPTGHWAHEGWNGFKEKLTVLYPARVTVVHQNHFSEPTALKDWAHLGANAARRLPQELYHSEPQWRCDLVEDRLGYHF